MSFAYKQKQYFNYADYQKWDDGERWELIDGVAFCMSPAPSPEHQEISGNIFYHIKTYIAAGPCKVFSAPFDVRLPRDIQDQDESIDTVVQPDIVVICDPRKIDSRGCVGVPDFIVEILSPYTSDRDMRDKFYLYERAGVMEYWIVDPGTRTVHAYQLIGNGAYGSVRIYFDDDNIQSQALPGLVIGVDAIFPEKNTFQAGAAL